MASDRIVGLTAGTWDFVHAGHVIHFEECKKHCDYLIAGIQVDPSVDRPNKNKPIMSLEERCKMLRANKFIDAIVVYETQEDLYKLHTWLPVDVRFMGIDHKGPHKRVPRPIVYTPRDHPYSSSEIRKRVCEAS